MGGGEREVSKKMGEEQGEIGEGEGRETPGGIVRSLGNLGGEKRGLKMGEVLGKC